MGYNLFFLRHLIELENYRDFSESHPMRCFLCGNFYAQLTLGTAE